jgi:hypothetical protein
MSNAFRPSWLPRIDSEGSPESRRPRLLVALLLGFGVLAGVTGGGIGSAINDDRILPGVIAAMLWAAPYFLSALFCWYGADRFWYALPQGLGIWGAVIAGGALYWLPQIGNPGGGPSAPMGSLLWILPALLIGNATIFVTARGEARRHARDDDSLLYWVYALLPIWYLMTVLVG